MPMAISFSKRELEKKKQGKKLEKQKRKEERKANAGNGSFEDMIAYVDENGLITDTPPDMNNKQEINIEDIAVSTLKKEETEETVLRGRVEYFNEDRGFGFIKDVNSTEKYFFYITSVQNPIVEGNMVTFELERGRKGMNAVRIALAS